MLRKLKQLLWKRSENTATSKYRRYKNYEYLDPLFADAHKGHDCVWTEAPGIWCCNTCHKWYRTWLITPKRDPRQERKW